MPTKRITKLKKKIGVAQIGVGYWGPNLLRNLAADRDCRVRAVADLSEERRDFVKKTYPQADVFKDAEDLFGDPSIDAVVIATPVATHFELAMKALRAGKHVLVEKPMARTSAEVERIRDLSRIKRLVAMAGHTFIYNSAVRYLKSLIDSGELGDIRYIYSQRVNLGRIRPDVDALWNFGPHDISIVQYLLGNQRPLSIVKRGMDYIQPGIDDVVFFNIVYPGKIMVNIHLSWLDPHKMRLMTVVGSKKMALYDDMAEDKIIIYDKGIDRLAVLGEGMDFDNPAPGVFKHRSGKALVPKIKFVEPLKAEIAHFMDCIKNGTECMTGPEHALEVVRILSGRLSGPKRAMRRKG